MKKRDVLAIVLIALGTPVSLPALACGDGEAPTSCGDTGPEAGAQWMLQNVVKAIARDKSTALAQFTKGEGGFRTADTYVFCVGPDGIMSSHPNPILRGHDVRDLHDKTGNYFIRTMMQEAKPGSVSVIRYLFPKPGSTVEEPKTTYYTKAGDQMCAVGIYDADTIAPKAGTPEARVSALRAKLDGEISGAARADWTAFLEALKAQDEARQAMALRARERLKAAAAALDATEAPTSGSDD